MLDIPKETPKAVLDFSSAVFFLFAAKLAIFILRLAFLAIFMFWIILAKRREESFPERELISEKLIRIVIPFLDAIFAVTWFRPESRCFRVSLAVFASGETK